jgi:hypothetical protein
LGIRGVGWRCFYSNVWGRKRLTLAAELSNNAATETP